MNWFFQAVRWLAKIFEEGATGNPSVKRVALVITVVALAIAVVILALAAFFGHAVGAELMSVSASLASVGGYSYVQGKKIEGQQNSNRSV